MTQQTAVEYLIEKLYIEYRFEFSGTIVDRAKQMEKDLIRNTLILFCNTESYGACDVKDWVKTNGVCFKPKDTDNQIKDRVDYFINNIVNQHK